MLGWQLRLGCVVTSESDGLDVTSRWAMLRHTRAAQDYLEPLAPGSVLSAPGYATESAPGAVRGTFTLLRAQVLEMDWLSLDPDGHRRAVFDYRDAAPAARWLVP